MGLCYRKYLVWVNEIENAILDQACEALNGIGRSQLMQEAVLFEACRLRVRWSAAPPPAREEPWRYMPDRRRESASIRLGISASITLAEVIGRAARYVDASEPKFIVGATLAYIGRLQRCYACEYETPEEREKIRAALREIKIPAQYQYRARRAK